METIRQDVDRLSTHEKLSEIANLVRHDGFEMVLNANSGHLGGSSSSVELLTCLYFGGQFNFDLDDPQNEARDRVLIRGHEGPVRYPIFSLLGYLERDELSSYRQIGSRLQGHEDMHITPGVDITPSGSLGMLLSYGIGAAATIKNQGRDQKVIVFLGDGEEQEGNVSEAARHGATLGLDNVICIIDANKKQLSRGTEAVDGNTNIYDTWRGYGWDVIEIKDGHDITEILGVYDQLQAVLQPTVVIANTVKGNGLDGAVEHFSGYHTISVCDQDVVINAIRRLKQEATFPVDEISKLAKTMVSKPSRHLEPGMARPLLVDIKVSETNNVNLDYAQFHYFKEFRKLLALQEQVPLYVLTPDFLRDDAVRASKFPEYSFYYDTGLREQHTIGMAHGISTTDPSARIFINYGDAFLYRALDQINAAAQGGSNILIAGEYAGVSQAQNGKTHQSLSQPGSLMQIPEVAYFEPADVQDLYNIFNRTLGANSGLTYVRIHPKNVAPLERSAQDAANTDGYVTFDTDKETDITVFAAGMPVGSTVEAAKSLYVEQDTNVRVVNVINPKSISDQVLSYIIEGKPALAVYNGNPAILCSQLGMAVLSQAGPRPSILTGHGFTEGTSGSISDLESFTQLDMPGIKAKIQQALRGPKR